MGARKTDDAISFDPADQPGKCLMLAADKVCVRKSGIEFHSQQPMSPWTEMTVTLHIPGVADKVNCDGVIVAWSGNAKAGYLISMLFTNLSRQSQFRLRSMAQG